MPVQVLDNGLYAPDGVLQYAWFHLATPDGERFRCIALRELSSIPIAVREDYDLLGKQWAAVRGLYNAGVHFLYSAAGIFTPEHIGIVQYYGAAAEDCLVAGGCRPRPDPDCRSGGDAGSQLSAIDHAPASLEMGRVVRGVHHPAQPERAGSAGPSRPA